MSRLFLIGAACAALYACSETAKAAEFKQTGLTMTMTGRIAPGDAYKLHAAMRGAPPAVLVIDSDGGYINDAVAIADWLRQAHTLTEVRGTCWSACVIVFAAGYQRWVGPGASFAVHRAALNGVEDEQSTRDLAATYRRLKIPERITAKMLATPASTFDYLTPDDLAAWQVKPKV